MRTKRLHALLFFVYAFSCAIFSQTLLRDINSATNNTDFSHFGYFKGEIYFSAYPEASTGVELYRTNIESKEIEFVKDIFPGENSSNAYDFKSTGSLLFFNAISGNYSPPKLMQSDGTPEGTIIVKNLLDTFPFYPDAMEVLGDELIFPRNSMEGQQLWKTNGTLEGTRPFFTLPQFTNVNAAVGFIKWDNYLFFVFSNELWLTDGTEAGTKKVFPFGSEAVANPEYFVSGSDGLYFWTQSTSEGIVLWKTNGQTNGTIKLRSDFLSFQNGTPLKATSFQDKVYFVTGLNENFRMWVSDGTPGGTKIFSELGDLSVGSELVGYNGKIYLAADHYSEGYELWEVPAIGDPILIKDIVPDGSNIVRQLFPFDGKLYFTADDGIHGEEIWVSDGSSSGTHLLMDIYDGYLGSAPQIINSDNGQMFFLATSRTKGRELWTISVTDSLPTLFYDLNQNTGNSDVYAFYPLTNQVLFNANDPTFGMELWKHDNGLDGTFLVKDIYPGVEGSFPDITQVFKDHLFFFAGDSVDSRKLYFSDGTLEGTKPFNVFNDGKVTLFVGNYIVCNEKLFFTRKAWDDENFNLVEEVWYTLGDSAQTYQANLKNDLSLDGELGNFTCVNDYLIFSSVNQYLYRIDEDPNSIDLLGRLPNAATSTLSNVTPVSTGFVCTYEDEEHGRELWISNGDEGGTKLLLDILPGPESSSPEYFFKTSEGVFFFCQNSNYLKELWKTDGTISGTRRVSLIEERPLEAYFVSRFAQLEGKIFFSTQGWQSQLVSHWVSDGTDEGTQKYFTAFFNGDNNNVEKKPVAHKGLVYFVGHDSHGYELWQTDGTPENTKIVFDLCEGPCESRPSFMTSVGDHLYFTAYTLQHGREPYKFKPVSTGIRNAEDRKADELILIYPNPSSNDVHIRLKSPLASERKINISLKNVQGQIVYVDTLIEVATGEFILPTEGLMNGIYFLQIQNQEKYITEKLILQRN